MRNGLDRRLSRLEKQMERQKQTIRVCNCRVETRFHGADCLAAILKSTPRVCAVHGFRDLGFIFWQSRQYPLGSGDDQFCPCPPHPWRSWVLGKGPHPIQTDQETTAKFLSDPMSNFEDDKRRSDAVIAEYSTARRQWAAQSGREFLSPQELVKLQMKRVRSHAGQ
jgi:hypothetical protein